MSYLYNKLKPKAKFHFWIDVDGMKQDTVCRLWSTGGINQRRKGWSVVAEKPDRDLCHMCSERDKSDKLLLENLGL
jgi:hypothetical protein